MTRLVWKRGKLQNWYNAFPLGEDDIRTSATIHCASGRPKGTPSWLWSIRVNMVVQASGAAFSKQAASDAANRAWEKLSI